MQLGNEKIFHRKFHYSCLTKFHHFIPSLFLFALLVPASLKAQVTGIYTDYGGYWASSTTSLNSTKPDNNHNLLAFTYSGTTFSTGVNDALLTTHSVSFTPLNFRAFPVNTVPNTASGQYFVMLGQQYDGITNGVDNGTTAPFPASPAGADLAAFLTDGVKGLDLGTGLANIPAGSVIRFELSANGISSSAINDGKPDILVTQLASPTSTNPDVLKFVDINGNTVGNTVSIVTSTLPVVGNWQADFYDLNSTQANSSYINQSRPMAFYAADLGTFGITAANFASAVALVYQPNGTSDPGFIAFNEPAISVATQLSISTQPTVYQYNTLLSPAPAIQVKDGLGQPILQSGIPVTASVGAGSGTTAGTVTVNTDASGIATFSNLKIAGSGTIKLLFSSASLNTALSANITDNTTTLPVSWLSFTASLNKNIVTLSWQTATEQNASVFSVQRSHSGASWTTIGTLSASGNSNFTHSYQFTDTLLEKGPWYYHIMETDADGRTAYSEVRSVDRTQKAGFTLKENPVRNGQLVITAAQSQWVRLWQPDGRLLWQKMLYTGTQQLSSGNLSAGLYYLGNDEGYIIPVLVQ
jgi:hypothetical protein